MVAATFPQRSSCENVGTLSCCNIFQESFKNVATTLPHNVVRKHINNIMATLIHFDNIEVLRYSQCCGNLAAIWETQRRSYHDMLQKTIDGVKSDAHNISLADFMFHFR